jgi:hypothetical protein
MGVNKNKNTGRVSIAVVMLTCLSATIVLGSGSGGERALESEEA